MSDHPDSTTLNAIAITGGAQRDSDRRRCAFEERREIARTALARWLREEEML